MGRLSYPKEKINILLLEGIDPSSAQEFSRAGYAVEQQESALSEAELLARIPDLHVLGVRSKTHVTDNVLEAAQRLLAIGCFCIGTNQVALQSASKKGVPVFNAPFSNTRSVAELAIAEVVMLARRAAHRSMLLHQGRWEKSASGSYEVRHKTLGIVGYGHIGPQVGLLAESLGMHVLFYDIVKKLPLGNALPVDSLETLLQRSDFVTLHVPETLLTSGMIGPDEIARMKQGSYLLNLSRGTVVQLDALRDAILSGHLAGAGVDVFPEEPKSNSEQFTGELKGLENVILTPHIGGSTQEAQENIGLEVAIALVNFLDSGRTGGAVNFPHIDLPMREGVHRVLNVHKNMPGVLSQINSIVAEMGANIVSQSLATHEDVGYLIMDVDPTLSREVKSQIEDLDFNLKTRLLF